MCAAHPWSHGVGAPWASPSFIWEMFPQDGGLFPLVSLSSLLSFPFFAPSHDVSFITIPSFLIVFCSLSSLPFSFHFFTSSPVRRRTQRAQFTLFLSQARLFFQQDYFLKITPIQGSKYDIRTHTRTRIYRRFNLTSPQQEAAFFSAQSLLPAAATSDRIPDIAGTPVLDELLWTGSRKTALSFTLFFTSFFLTPHRQSRTALFRQPLVRKRRERSLRPPRRPTANPVFQARP